MLTAELTIQPGSEYALKVDGREIKLKVGSIANYADGTIITSATDLETWRSIWLIYRNGAWLYSPSRTYPPDMLAEHTAKE